MAGEPGGFTDELGRRFIYTGTLSDEATWTLEYLRFLHARLVANPTGGEKYADVEACQACAEYVEDRTESIKRHFGLVAWFLQGFAEQFKRKFEETPYTFWAQLHRKGMEELRDFGIVEGMVKDTTTQLWNCKKVWFTRVLPTRVELKEG